MVGIKEITFGVIILIFSVFSGLNSSVRSKLDSLKQELNEKKKKLKELSTNERGVVSELAKLDREIAFREEIISSYATEESLIRVELDTLNIAFETVKKNLNDERAMLTELIRYEYKKGKIGFLGFIFAEESLAEMLERAYFVRLISLARKGKFFAYLEGKSRLETIIKEREKALAELDSIRLEKQNEISLLRSNRKNRENKLKEIRAKKEEYEDAIERLKRSRAELEKLIETETALSRRAAKVERTKESSAFKGKLNWPIKGRKEIIRHFGFIRDNRFGSLIYNSGIDIKAEPGEPVYAVCDGDVVFVGWLHGYDNVVILKHPGDFYTVYGNLGSINVSKGNRVSSQTRLGNVSSTGWLDGPKLHFEVRVGKKEVNPIEWLVRR